MRNNLIFIYKLNKMDIFSSIMQTWNILRGGKSIERWLDSHILIDGSVYMKMYKVFLLKYDFTRKKYPFYTLY